MSYQRRMFEHNSVYFITNRVVDGLPFVPNAFITELLSGILAEATQRFPEVSVNHWLFMGNHYHGIVTTTGDPKKLANFMNLVNGEIGKIVNRLLGRKNRNVWAQPYHAAKLCDYEATMKQIAYLYSNPSEANLVDSVSEWRGVSTWAQALGTDCTNHKAIFCSQLRQLPRNPFNKRGLQLLLEELSSLKGRTVTFQVDPFSWKKCFRASRNFSDEAIRRDLTARVDLSQANCQKRRRNCKQGVVGIEGLAAQCPYKHFRPKKYGRKVFCIATDLELRLQLIEFYKDFCKKSKAAWHAWRDGNFSVPFPPGAFLPPRPPLANLLPIPL